jgi:hypothetical protein
MNKYPNRYRVECKGNTCYKVYQKKTFMFIPHWSYLCTASSFAEAKKLINNLSLINAS